MAEIVLVHGLFYGPLSMRPLAWRLKHAGWRCRLFSYTSVHAGLPENARRLYRFVSELDVDEMHFVCHSLGGLVTLRMLDEYGKVPPGRVVLMGSPVKGSGVAMRAKEIKVTRALMGQSAPSLIQGFDRAPADRETGLVVGTRGLGLGRVVPGLHEPSDGTVAVSETELPGAADRIELPISHTGMLFSPRVARKVHQFLQTGRF